uniref:Uncharacterized protein n=1 Tax=Noctiluca scintillans TaxID=2966 RepID=A0A7S1F868_NOCSC
MAQDHTHRPHWSRVKFIPPRVSRSWAMQGAVAFCVFFSFSDVFAASSDRTGVPVQTPRLDLSTLPGLVDGWNTSVGTNEEREAAAEYFGVVVSDDASLWLSNALTPFVGKTLKMTGIDIKERNTFNTVIELAVNTGTVLWTIQHGPQTAGGDWIETINGGYTGFAQTAGWVSKTQWLENDSKSFLGYKIKDDWGMITVLNVTENMVVMDYWSYLKSKFVMTWSLVEQV